MAIEIEFSDGGLGSIVTGRGRVSSEEYLGFYNKFLLQADLSLFGYCYSLTDWTAVTEVSITPDDISDVARLSRRAAEKSPGSIAAVVASDDFLFGLSRMWENHSLNGDSTVMVFRERGKAESWIREQFEIKHGTCKLEFR